MQHSKTPAVKNQSPLSTRSRSLIKVCIGSRSPSCRTALHDEQDKTRKASPNEQWNTPQDLICNSGNRTKILPKSHLGIKCHSRYIMVIRLLQYSSLIGWLGVHCAWPGDYHCLSLTRSQLIKQRSRHSLTLHPAEVTVQELCKCNSNARGWHNSYEGGVISITDKLILEHGEKLWGVQEEQ